MAGRVLWFVCVLLVSFTGRVRPSSGDIFEILRCVREHSGGQTWNTCSEGKFWEFYNKMKDANCRNCDKYFHCMANHEAVYGCSGDHQIHTAEVISNCRDDPSCTEQDCLDDREANSYGRNGGDCASRYLCSYRCSYNPADGTCLKSNCP